MPLTKIVSGGQTGVDRGALDAALDHRFPCGGWCPPGRLAEDGPIDLRYPLREMASGGYEARTVQNVIDSDATLVIHFGAVEGGTALTVRECRRRRRPCRLIDGEDTPATRAAELVLDFIGEHSVSTLNVAGPRETNAPQAREYAREVIRLVLQATRP
jgi:hypothetical protein